MDDFEKLLNKTYNFLSYRIRTEKEIRDYLIKKIKGKDLKKIISDSDRLIIESVIARLKEQKFLNDEEFIKLWIESRSRTKSKSLKFLIFELERKGIKKELINSVLGKEEIEIASDFDKALSLAKKRIDKYKNEDRKKAFEKMARYLVSKGYDWELIKKVIDHVLGKGYNT
jgi:regulatory protein